MPIKYEIDDQVVLITIDRPEQRNCLDADHNERLREALLRFEDDSTLRAAVITGSGTLAFSAGADLKTLVPAVRESIEAGNSPEWHFGHLTQGTTFTKPTVAALNGDAFAGGLELALACDIRIASPTVRLGLSETRWGLVPGAGGTVRLPRLVPLGIALEMILTGDSIDAESAVKHGLVNRLVEPDQLVDEAINLARVIATRSPRAVQSARQSVLRGLSLDPDLAMRLEHEEFIRIMQTKDAIEGPAAFAEKRPPKFENR